MKRAAFLMIAVGSVFANSGADDAMAVAGVALSYAEQRIAADMRDAMAFIASATAGTYAENYKEALNLVRQAYARERLDVRSAATLALGDTGVTAEVNALADTLTASETADIARVKLAAKAAAARLKTTFTDAPVLTAAEQAAAKLVPTRVANPPASPAGPAAATAPSLTGYYVQEARNFADGTRSILDIRNAISAEFGPVPVESVVTFFRAGERAGQYTIK